MLKPIDDIFRSRTLYIFLAALYLLIVVLGFIGEPKVEIDLGGKIAVDYRALAAYIPVYLGVLQGLLLTGLVFLVLYESGRRKAGSFWGSFFRQPIKVHLAVFMLLFLALLIGI